MRNDYTIFDHAQKPNRVTDKSGEPETCDMCGFRAGNHLATCPLSRNTDDQNNILSLAAARANRRRFTGNAVTGFGGLT